MDLFSPAQMLGYVALVLGVAAFLQKSDGRLKLLLSTQSIFYTGHFLLLGNFPASGSSIVSGARTALSIRCKSLWLGAVALIANAAVGAMFAKTGIAWLPVIGSCAATIAFFTMQGVGLRSVLFGCTLCWLANNIATHSVGGIMLESFIAVTNGTTIIRMLRPGYSEQN